MPKLHIDFNSNFNTNVMKINSSLKTECDRIKYSTFLSNLLRVWDCISVDYWYFVAVRMCTFISCFQFSVCECEHFIVIRFNCIEN